MGAEAIRELLRDLNLRKTQEDLRKEFKETTGQKRLKAIKRLEVVEAFLASGNKPEWMVLSAVPVIAPELRPMVQLDGGRFATSDSNDLYRRVINRNNRLKRLLELSAPEIIIKNEKRMLQEAVDALIDNGRRGRPVTGPEQPSAQIALAIFSKASRAASGRTCSASASTIPAVRSSSSVRTLKLHQCGLPKEMALELFKPFVMKKLVDRALSAQHQEREAHGRARASGSLGRARRSHQASIRCCSTAHRRCIVWAFRRSNRCWWKAKRSICIRSSARRTTPTSTATRWPCIFRCRPARRPKRAS